MPLPESPIRVFESTEYVATSSNVTITGTGKALSAALLLGPDLVVSHVPVAPSPGATVFARLELAPNGPTATKIADLEARLQVFEAGQARP